MLLLSESVFILYKVFVCGIFVMYGGGKTFASNK